MKYIIILGDGMSDWPDESGQTPLSLAFKPNIDRIAALSEIGLCQTIPDGMSPGSDTANLSVMGCDPRLCYSGRSPLEALSMGIRMNGGDTAYRVNLVTLSEDPVYGQKTMLDYSAGEIGTEEARGLIELIKPCVPDGCELFAGISYRHVMIERPKPGEPPANCPPPAAGCPLRLTPPHDISGKKVAEFLPEGAGAEKFTEFMQKSCDLLKQRRPFTAATSAWVWGAGTKPNLPSFEKEFGLKGAMISAVNLLKGIGVGMGLESVDVPGATGTLHTNFDGKAAAAIDALKTCDFVFLHLEAPDECGHQGDKAGKIRAIELIDEKIVGPLLAAFGDGRPEQADAARNEPAKNCVAAPFKLLILPDHATPLCLKTHTSDPVPYLLYDAQNKKTGVQSFTEASAQSSGVLIREGHHLIKRLIP